MKNKMKDKKTDKTPEKSSEKTDKSDQVGVTIDGGIMSKKIVMPNLPKPLSLEEKKYLLAVERGDLANVRRIIHRALRKKNVNIDCVDPLGRGALTLAIDSENLEMVELLVVLGVQTKDSLLQAIDVGFVEAVELLLEHEELVHKEGEPYSWEKVDWNTATFTRDITPLILAAHRNNYEILKILLDRGATLPMPHEIRCGCEECIKESTEDSLHHSRSRINEYKALASPSLMALSSSDPILSAFELSWDLRNLAFTEQESKSDYLELRRQCQQFAVDLLSQARSSLELAIVLNHDPESPPYVDGEHMKLARLELAINYKQKKFVAHPNIQQLLATMWYDGLPGFRRKSLSAKLVDVCVVALLFPFYCMLYLVAPNTATGKLIRKPFMKFLIHASSYLFFLLLLILVSQRVEDLVNEFFASDSLRSEIEKQEQIHRGHGPKILEIFVGFYVLGFIWEETVEIWTEGIRKYLRNLWNFIDFTRNSLYVGVFVLRVAAYWQQKKEIFEDPNTAYIPREMWDPFDPQLIAEGLFAAANVFSALKLVHLFSINPHLGPLQISLGRMVIDIVKFFFIYSLVLFAFACGLNQLLWYFAELERRKCYSLPGGIADWDNKADSCSKWRNFGNLFESTQSLFWASFGGIGTDAFQLTGIKTYTRFWGLLMFGSYSVINVIVLLNLLIAMMSNSYAMIDEHSDTEWKFARTKLWLSYFEESATLPPPFNIFPTPKMFMKLFGLRKKDKMRRMSTKRKEREEKERDYRYTAVMRALVWRYISGSQRHADDNPVTEDDVNEIKTEISAMKCEILNVLDRNGMDISSADATEKTVLGKKMKVWERRLMKDFHVAPVAPEEEMDFLMREPPENEDVLSKFRRIAKLAVLNSAQQKWGQVIKGACKASQIGHCNSREAFKNQQCLQKAMQEAQKLVCRSPKAGPRSPSPANVSFPETTGTSIMELLQDFSKETEESPEPRKRAASKQSLLDIQPKSMMTGLGRSKTPSPLPSKSPKPKPSPINQSTASAIKGLESEQHVIIPTVSISPPPASSKPKKSDLGIGAGKGTMAKSVGGSEMERSAKIESEVIKGPEKTPKTDKGIVGDTEKVIEPILPNDDIKNIDTASGSVSAPKPDVGGPGKSPENISGVSPQVKCKEIGTAPPSGPGKCIETQQACSKSGPSPGGTEKKLDKKTSPVKRPGILSDTRKSTETGSGTKNLQATPSTSLGRSPPPSPRPERKSPDSVSTDWKYGEEIMSRPPPLSASSPSYSSQEALIPPSPPEQVSTPIRLKGQVKLVKRQPREGWL